jgi:predicted metal-binding membrane protein
VKTAAREALPGWIALLIVTALAWRRTLADAATMGDAPGTMGMPFMPFLAMWVPMMAAMMLPAITPVATLWTRSIARKPRRAERLLRLLLFAGGYLLVWAGAGALAFALMRPVEIGLEAGAFSARTAATVVFALAGLYQLSPLREACLAKCRSPSTVLGVMTAGPAAVRDLRAGALHGAWCLACCWSLMAVLALVGLMNVGAMVLLAVFIFFEKTTRFGVPAGRLAGVLMLAAAIATVGGAIPF